MKNYLRTTLLLSITALSLSSCISAPQRSVTPPTPTTSSTTQDTSASSESPSITSASATSTVTSTTGISVSTATTATSIIPPTPTSQGSSSTSASTRSTSSTSSRPTTASSQPTSSSHTSSSSSQSTSTSKSTTQPGPEGYYSDVKESMTGATLQSTLKSIISKNVSVSYDWSRYEDADQDLNKSSNVILVYTRASDSKSNHVNGKKGWNREHSFPQSKMSTPQSEHDNHVIFASDNQVNNKRSNYRLGNLDGKSPNVYDYNGNITKCKLNEKNGEKFFDPGDTPARGEVARATLYAAVMYDYEIDDNFETIALCLQWHLNYSIQERDIYRNDAVYKNQHNRNPFVDHPEYACRIWGSTNSQTKQVCGM